MWAATQSQPFLFTSARWGLGGSRRHHLFRHPGELRSGGGSSDVPCSIRVCTSVAQRPEERPCVASIAERLGGALADALRAVPALAPYAGPIAFVTVVVAITYLSLIIGELVPKRLALNGAEAVASLGGCRPPDSRPESNISEVQLGDTERLSVRRVMSSSCSQPFPTKE
ncbi:MAG TPA: CNNM domain-containing protein [Rubrobacter sp.]|nr:CNNM domain-containing protein [Rubrobacter sp.]